MESGWNQTRSVWTIRAKLDFCTRRQMMSYGTSQGGLSFILQPGTGRTRWDHVKAPKQMSRCPVGPLIQSSVLELFWSPDHLWDDIRCCGFHPQGALDHLAILNDTCTMSLFQFSSSKSCYEHWDHVRPCLCLQYSPSNTGEWVHARSAHESKAQYSVYELVPAFPTHGQAKDIEIRGNWFACSAQCTAEIPPLLLLSPCKKLPTKTLSWLPNRLPFCQTWQCNVSECAHGDCKTHLMPPMPG